MSALPPIPNSARLLVVVGPSGAGKDTVLRAWRARLGDAPVHFAQRVITRPPDDHEGHESASGEGFRQLILEAQLATWWQANALSYGIRWCELQALANGGWVVVNGSRAHLPALRLQAPALRAVQISAPEQVLKERLETRGREQARAIGDRLDRHIPAVVDLRVTNDGDVADAVAALHGWWAARASPAAA